VSKPRLGARARRSLRIRANVRTARVTTIAPVNVAADMIRCLPSRYAPFVYGIIQAAVTTGVATAVATSRVVPFSAAWIRDWLVAWAIGWTAMLPVVVLAARLIRRLVQAMTISHRTDCNR
jgi:hypothetical protein